MRYSETRRERTRRRGRLWLLLFALLGLGIAATVVRRRGNLEEGLEGPDHGDGAFGDRLGERAGRAAALKTPPEEPVPEGESVWIAGPAGNLYVRDGGLDHEGRLPVLFVHSLGGNGGQWALQLDHLRRERRAAAVDLRGHGDSDPADDGDYSIESMAGDVAAAADQLGLRHFVLAGHSLGGAVAVEYAGRHPERVAGLLLVDPNGDQTQVPAEQMEPFLEALRRDPLREMDWYFRQLVAAGDPEAGRWVLEDLALTDEAVLVGGIESSTRYQPLPALARYPGPRISIISDMNDLPFSLHRLLPDLPVRLLAGTGHWLQMDRPEPFNRLLDEFLAGVEGRT
jgi:pimeloyl-ACP methyl ester carboxylesterase